MKPVTTTTTISLIYKNILITAGIMTILYLFYRSIWILTLLLPCIAVCRRINKKDAEKRSRAVLGTQFKDMLDSLAASLRAGYSIENALKECLREMAAVHGEDSPICKELVLMVNQVSIGISAESIFRQFARRSHVEDIDTFASVFSIAKRTGGDMVEIINRTAQDIGAKIDTKNEIGVLISSRKLEMKIMMLIPAAIILYIDITSSGLLDPLYGNLRGVIIMTVCLAVYGAAVLLGRKLTDIEV